ncbi:MAG: nuclear transport factor 2 family protein [Candidatus Heimdallarchaeota archaeon]|nr:nuclear transport factor 2 family protein [Candidatus Heimdallarchaeota archaeon]
MEITKEEAQIFLTSFGKMYETKDLKGVEKTLHPDLFYFGIGTTAEDEIRLKRDDALRGWERDFRQIDGIEDFVVDLLHFDSVGEVAWVGGFFKYRMWVNQQEFFDSLRFTMVLHKVDNKIFRRQYHHLIRVVNKGNLIQPVRVCMINSNSGSPILIFIRICLQILRVQSSRIIWKRLK